MAIRERSLLALMTICFFKSLGGGARGNGPVLQQDGSPGPGRRPATAGGLGARDGVRQAHSARASQGPQSGPDEETDKRDDVGHGLLTRGVRPAAVPGPPERSALIESFGDGRATRFGSQRPGPKVRTPAPASYIVPPWQAPSRTRDTPAAAASARKRSHPAEVSTPNPRKTLPAQRFRGEPREPERPSRVIPRTVRSSAGDRRRACLPFPLRCPRLPPPPRNPAASKA